MKKYMYLFSIFVLCLPANAQFLKDIKNKVITKTENKVDKGVDKEIDAVVDGSGKNDKVIERKDIPEKVEVKDPISSNDEVKAATVQSTESLGYTSKFDFVPGEEVVYYEDFTNEIVGDFPSNWNTTGSGEVVLIDGLEGKWLLMQQQSNFTFDHLLKLPENCTIQFDIMLSLPFNWASNPLLFALGDIKNPNNFMETQHYSLNDNRNMTFWMNLHPGSGTSNSNGYGGYLMNNTSTSNLVNEKLDLRNYFMDQADKLPLKVSIWKQKQRLRIYLNENKVLDLPKILPLEMNINTIVWQTNLLQDDNKYFIGNIRIAAGAPDLRNKLLTEGKLISNGILFGTNSDIVKPVSLGILKEIAQVLKENPSVNIAIVGHTDSDGNDDANLELSKKRALAVKNILASDFSIASVRMSVEGKGAAEPLLPNSNAINKANNRRVEFIKVN